MKRTRLEKLLAVYEKFGSAISKIPDNSAQQLYATCAGLAKKAAARVAELEAAVSGPMATGLEQGLRDVPDFIVAVAPEWRPQVAQGFLTAVSAEYPEFFEKDAKRLEKIQTRGKIDSESEFYLVRHHVERLEGRSESVVQLDVLNRLMGDFELRRKQGLQPS